MDCASCDTMRHHTNGYKQNKAQIKLQKFMAYKAFKDNTRNNIYFNT